MFTLASFVPVEKRWTESKGFVLLAEHICSKNLVVIYESKKIKSETKIIAH